MTITWIATMLCIHMALIYTFLHHIWKRNSSVLAAMSDAFAVIAVIAFEQLLVAKGSYNTWRTHEFKNGKFYYVFTNYSVASVTILPKIQSVYAKQNSVTITFDATLVIGEYELPLGALFVDEHPGYTTALRLNTINKTINFPHVFDHSHTQRINGARMHRKLIFIYLITILLHFYTYLLDPEIVCLIQTFFVVMIF
eukprot:376185_1